MGEVLRISGIAWRRIYQTFFFLVLCLASWPFASAETVSTVSLKKAYATAELDQMLAPVALYPDEVLLAVLKASSFPGEVGEAARWLCSHPDVTGEAAIKAAKGKNWKKSVKALLAFPGVLAAMSSRMEWTVKAGQAFRTQPEDVLDRIQFLRRKAKAAGCLKSDELTTVVMMGRDIAIEPALPETIFIPCYYSRMVYGSWQPRLHGLSWQFVPCGDVWHAARCMRGEVFRFHGSRFLIDWPHRRVNMN